MGAIKFCGISVVQDFVEDSCSSASTSAQTLFDRNVITADQ